MICFVYPLRDQCNRKKNKEYIDVSLFIFVFIRCFFLESYRLSLSHSIDDILDMIMLRLFVAPVNEN